MSNEKAHLKSDLDSESTLCGENASEWINCVSRHSISKTCPKCLDKLAMKEENDTLRAALGKMPCLCWHAAFDETNCPQSIAKEALKRER